MTIVKDYQIIKSILGNNNKRYDEVHLSIPDQEIFFLRTSFSFCNNNRTILTIVIYLNQY